MFGSDVKRFTLRTLDEVCDVSSALARYFSDSGNIRVGLYELLLNAVEHGNLGIGFDRKTALLREGRWDEEIKRRLLMPVFCDRFVTVDLVCDALVAQIAIADQGRGFFWRGRLRRSLDASRPNGRGLIMAEQCGFNRIAYNPLGNKVVCTGVCQNIKG
ncbi:MAG: ATP-binding protein [Alphaproteobacteria bacterium]|nr:ATP-binding protein [Alphaproteobacteria bacterium]